MAGRKYTAKVSKLPPTPKWYSLREYDSAEHFTLSRWNLELWYRRSLWEALEHRQIDFVSKIPLDSDRGKAIFCERLSKLPFGHHSEPDSKPPTGAALRSVVPVDVFTLGIFWASVFRSPQAARFEDDFRVCRLDSDITPESRRKAYNDIGRLPIDSGSALSSTLAHIDWRASDAQLREDFEALLAKERARAASGRERLVDAYDMQQWHQFRVLAYLDLDIWSRFTLGKRLTFPYLGDLLFPDEIGVDRGERVRETVKSKADNLMNLRVLLALQAQANRAGKVKG